MTPMVRTPLDGEVHVHYGQLYVESDPDSFGPGLAEAFAGQSVGLCGAAIPGALWLSTGLHTGQVGFTVEVHDEEPPLSEVWEDVVEVSFHPASDETALSEWGGGASWNLDLEETDYRVRYSALGMDQAGDVDTRMDGEPQVDRYLLQFWPSVPAPDRVIRQTSQSAAHWHDYARRQPPPPTPAEREEAERAARLTEEQAERERQLAYERWEWGGRLPSPALRAVRGNVSALRDFDPALVHAIDAAGPETQRTIALLAARRACTAAGLADLDWVASALTAVARQEPLPPPFDDTSRMWETLRNDPHAPSRTVTRAVPPERPSFRPPVAPGASPAPEPQVASRHRPATGPLAARAQMPQPQPTGHTEFAVQITLGPPDPSSRVSQPHMALPAVTGAAEADPLQAALDAVCAAVAAYGAEYPTLLEEVWSLCGGRS
ncbi:hypothetical protein ACWDR3_20865 [Streptomyces sp. NPDC001002]